MKIRKQVRALYKTLGVEVVDALSEHHVCKLFFEDSGRCVLCELLHCRKIFAAIHLAREHNLHMDWFEPERSLYELLGEKAFFNKIEIELKEVANYPRKECPSCGKIITFFISFKKLARSKNRNQRTKECNYCGHNVHISELPYLPPSKENNKPRENEAPRLRGRPLAVPRNIQTEPATIEDIGLQLINDSEKPVTVASAELRSAVEHLLPSLSFNDRRAAEEVLNGTRSGRFVPDGNGNIVLETDF